MQLHQFFKHIKTLLSEKYHELICITTLIILLSVYYWFVGMILDSKHGEFEKNFETEIKVDGKKISLNHFIQETLANILVGFLKTLKEADEPEKIIEIKIKKLAKNRIVDSHTYP
jgi:high-affinity nickel permease